MDIIEIYFIWEEQSIMFNKEFSRENNIITAKESQVAIKDIFSAMLHEMLEAELNEHLGYSRYDYKNKNTKNK